MSRLHALPLAGALFLANACGPAATGEPPAVPAAATATAEPAPTPPAQVTAGAMPGDVHFYAELSNFAALVSAARAAAGDAKFAEARAAIAKETGLSEQAVERLANAIASVHFGGKRAGDDVKAAVTVTFTDPQPVRDLIASGLLVDTGAFGPHGRALKEKGGSKNTQLWFEGPRVLAIGDEPITAAIGAVVEGRTPGLGDAQRAALTPANGERRVAHAFIAPALLDELASGLVSFPAPLVAAFGLWDGGLRGSYRAALAARDLESNLPIPPPRALAIARRLPAETASYAAISTGLPGGRQAAKQLLLQIVAHGGIAAGRAVTGIDSVLGEANMHIADLVALLGDEGVIGVVVRPSAKTNVEIERGNAVVVVQEVTDAKQVERVLQLVRDKLSGPKSKVKMRPDGAGFTVDLKDDKFPFLRIKTIGGRLFAGFGQRDMVDRATLALDKGKGTLGDDAAHARALTGLPSASHLRVWIDLGRALEMAAATTPPSRRAGFDLLRGFAGGSGATRFTSGLAFTAAIEPDRVRLELDEVNGIGAFAAIGIYGVRRYLARAKQAEAKNTIGAIARAAVAAYERELVAPGNTVQHQLCKSAQPVPSAVPGRTRYRPSSDPGRDWNTGDDETGWRCLKMMMSEPHHYQYTYIAGGPYKGPKRGGPDPGPNGFEVAAEGDLDGNGVTSLFTRVGKVDPKTGMVTLSTEMFVDKEDE